VEDENGRLVLRAQALAGRASHLPVEAERFPPDHVATCLREGRLIQLDTGGGTAAGAPQAEPGALPLLAAVPVQAGDQGLGAIELAWQRSFVLDDSRIRMAMTIASQAATALQAAALFSRISQSNNRLLAVLNSAHEGMLMMDVSGRVLVVNPQLQTLTGLPTHEMIGRSLSDARLPLAASLGYSDAEIERLLADLRQGEAIPGGSREFESPLDRLHALERTEAAVRDAQGMLIGWLVVLRDISQQKALDHAREQLTEMIVHDLRSPLTAVLGSLKLLQASLRPDERTALTEQALTVSQRSCQQMMEMVSSLLDLAKLESGEFQLRWEQVSLDALCQDLIALHIPEANALGIILELDVQAGLPRIRADGGMVRRCLSNLLDNALKFTPQGGRVMLSVVQQGTCQIVSVEDTGPGVPVEYRERIFERFGQIPGAAGRRRGTGLGLPFARLATEAHGGSIRVADGAEGGARFEILLPAETEPDASD
jgi:PAS domain S-box-containing protein